MALSVILIAMNFWRKTDFFLARRLAPTFC